ncbi:MAG: apolipoprotein N-acyltransferase [Planctomycetota bacterium]
MRRWLLDAALALVVAGLLALAAPGSAIPLAPILSIPALALLYGLCVRPRAARRVWLAGFLRLLFVSLSLVHVVGPGIVAIAAVGAFYWLLPVLVGRAGGRWGFGPLGFAIGLAAAEWLRAHMPEIPYPHAQPVHALAAWPDLLGPVAWLGEVGGNLLLAWLAAALVEGFVAPTRAPRQSIVVVILWAALTVVAPPRGMPAADAATSLRVIALQTGFPLPDEPRAEGARQRLESLARQSAAAIAAAGAPPDLLIWPESALDSIARLESRELLPRPDLRLAERTRILATAVAYEKNVPPLSLAVLTDARGRLLDWHEKQTPVPVGERVPGLDLMPSALREWMVAKFQSVVGFLPDLAKGAPRPPLRTASNVPFAALVCFDNAFEGIARRAVADGARLLVVVSNESWYRCGRELDQMLAMTVVRAIETATPVVRATVDGASAAVDARGRLIASLPRGEAGAGQRLILDVPLGPGRLGPMAWLPDALAVGILLTCALAAAQALFRRGRLGASFPGVGTVAHDPEARN